MKNLLVFALAIIVCVLSTAMADSKTFIGDVAKEPKILNFKDIENWDGGSLPTSVDDVVLKGGRFLFEPEDEAEIRIGSLESGEFGGFIYKGSFEVENDIQARMLAIGSSTQLFGWGGTLTLSSPNHWEPYLQIYGGLNRDGQTRVVGKDLSMKSKSSLIFTFYGSIPKGFPGNTEPILKLTGTLELGPEASIVFEGNSLTAPLSKGTYLLVQAQSITGEASLVLKSWKEIPAGAKLSISEGRVMIVFE